MNFRADTANKVRALLILVALLEALSSAACTGKKENSTSFVNKPGVNDEIEKLITKTDENGQPQEVAGYQVNKNLGRNDVIDATTPVSADSKIFTFSPPTGYSSEFSEPIMIDGSYLSSPASDACSGKAFYGPEPTLGDIFLASREQNICGQISFNFCIRLTPEDPTKEVGFITTPPVKMNLACPEQAFAAANVVINDNEKKTPLTNVRLSFAVTPLVTEMYVTNTPGCGGGGEWETSSLAKDPWKLSPIDDLGTVYVRFRDFIGHESTCLSDSIEIVRIVDAPPTITVAGSPFKYSTGDVVTISPVLGSSVTAVTVSPALSNGLTLNTANGVISGTATGTLSPTSYTLSASNQAGALTTASISLGIYDLPTAPSLSISGGATYTSSAAVSLSLGCTNPYQMYVTNTPGCVSGGSWQTYASNVAPWNLAQSNGTATVYVKFKNAADQETPCVSDTIIHDDSAPSSPTNVVNGTNTSYPSTTPTMSWTAASDGGSGVVGYEIAVGTTAGGTEVKDWTSVGNVTSASVNSLALTQGTVYYPSIRAVNGAGLVSPAANGIAFTYGTWKQQAYVKASNNTASIQFGAAVAISGDTVAIAASHESGASSTIINGPTSDTTTSASDAGAVFVYKRTATSWNQQSYIKAANNTAGNRFGDALSLTSDTLAIGAYLESSNQTTITNGTTASTNTAASGAGAVWVYKRTANAWAQQAYIKAANAEGGDNFGARVALSGDTLVVGSPNEGSNQTTITNGTSASPDNSSYGAGAAYVYARSATSWSQEAYLKAPNAEGSDHFGWVVSLVGDTIAVSAVDEDSNQSTMTNGSTASTNNANTDSGAVYIFQRSAGTWVAQAYLKPVNGDANDSFGDGLSLSNDVLAVGAKKEDSNQTTITNGTTASTNNGTSDSGAVYIYRRTATNWAQEAYIKAANSTASDGFGLRDNVSIDGDTLVVGALWEDGNQTTITNGPTAATSTSATSSGAVYVYQRSATAWSQQAYIKAPNSTASLEFGKMTALSIDTLVVGVPTEQSNQSTITNGTTASTATGTTYSGAAYIFSR